MNKTIEKHMNAALSLLIGTIFVFIEWMYVDWTSAYQTEAYLPKDIILTSMNIFVRLSIVVQFALFIINYGRNTAIRFWAQFFALLLIINVHSGILWLTYFDYNPYAQMPNRFIVSKLLVILLLGGSFAYTCWMWVQSRRDTSS